MARRRPLVRAAGKNQQIPAGDALALTGALDEAPIVTLASADTVAIGAAQANTLNISGTTTITAFDTIAAGARRTLRFAGALTLTHDTTKLILPRAANIVTKAGDAAEFVSLGSGNWACIGYQRATAEGAKGDVGLGNVNNTSDADKPISSATQSALDTKVSTSALRSDKTKLDRVLIEPADRTTTESALVVYRTLANTSTVEIPQSLELNFRDESSANRLSAQIFRLTYTRAEQAKGSPSSFDALQVLTPVIAKTAAYPIRGIVMEGPVMSSGTTLSSWVAVRIQSPTGDGSVSSRLAIQVEAGSGNSVFGKSDDNGRDIIQAYGSIGVSGPLQVGQYTLSTRPSASAYNGYEIDVTDAAGGPKRCRSDGSNWKILNTTTTVS